MTLLLVAVCSCAGPSRWRAADAPSSGETRELLVTGQLGPSALEVAAVPDTPMRRRLRPCCVFGMDVELRVGAVPVPGYRIGNVIGPEDRGPHHYDSGLLVVDDSGEDAFMSSEENGIIYTCKGGFIDTAHVRDCADWTIFLASQVCRQLEQRLNIELPAEGGARRLLVEPIAEPLIQSHGHEALTIAIA